MALLGPSEEALNQPHTINKTTLSEISWLIFAGLGHIKWDGQRSTELIKTLQNTQIDSFNEHLDALGSMLPQLQSLLAFKHPANNNGESSMAFQVLDQVVPLVEQIVSIMPPKMQKKATAHQDVALPGAQDMSVSNLLRSVRTAALSAKPDAIREETLRNTPTVSEQRLAF